MAGRGANAAVRDERPGPASPRTDETPEAQFHRRFGADADAMLARFDRFAARRVELLARGGRRVAPIVLDGERSPILARWRQARRTPVFALDVEMALRPADGPAATAAFEPFGSVNRTALDTVPRVDPAVLAWTGPLAGWDAARDAARDAPWDAPWDTMWSAPWSLSGRSSEALSSLLEDEDRPLPTPLLLRRLRCAVPGLERTTDLVLLGLSCEGVVQNALRAVLQGVKGAPALHSVSLMAPRTRPALTGRDGAWVLDRPAEPSRP